MGTAMKIVMICAVVAVLVGAGTVYYLTEPYSNGAEWDQGYPINKTDTPVIVVSDKLDQETLASYLENCTENVTVQNKMPSPTERTIIIIDGEWSGINDLKLNALLLSGVPVLCIGSSEVLDEERTGLNRSAFVEGAEVYGIHYKQTRDVVFCYSAVSDDLKSAIERSYDWADRVGEPMFVHMSGSSMDFIKPDRKSMYVFFDVKCDDYGWMRGMTTYTQITTDFSYQDPEVHITGTYTYGTHFRLQTLPNIGKSTAAMYVETSFTNDEQRLMDFGPLYIDGDRDGKIFVSGGPMPQWSYNGYGITTIPKSSSDNSIFMSGDFCSWNDIDISRKYDRPITVEPGKGSIPYGTKGYSGIDVYGIKFCEQKSRINVTYETFEVKCVVEWLDK